MKEIIREKVVGEVELSDLDLDVQAEVLGANPDGHDYEWVCDYDETKYYKEGDYISIDTFQRTHDELKAMGATHIQVSPHCDHHGYNFYGVVLESVEGQEAKEVELAIYKQKIINNEAYLKAEEAKLEEKRKIIEAQNKTYESLKENVNGKQE